MKKFIIVTLMALILLTNFVYANEGMFLKVINNSIYVEGYVETSLAGRVPAGIFQKINESMGVNIIQCDSVTITDGNITNTYQQNCTLNIDYSREIPFDFINSSSTIIGDSTLQRKYEECIELKAGLNAGLNSCVSSKNINQAFESNFTKCFTDLTICRSDKSNSETKYNDLKTETEEEKQSRWIWGIIGIVIGITGYAYKEGKIGGPKTKNPEDSFNAGQSA